MSPYETEIVYVEELPCSRAMDIVDAMDRLHTAISRLDNANFKKFWLQSLEERLSAYARVEDLREVVPEERRAL